MRQLREQLPEAQFWQIHRSIIVAAKFVESSHSDFRGRLMVKLKGRPEQLVVSRNYVDLFKQM
jgi:DNA-binding LytR/AlgR family response regulator